MITGRRMNGSRRFLPAIFCAALFLSGWAMAEGVSMQLEDQGHGAYRLEGHISVNATPYQTWKVLTDYENISKFVSSLRKSQIRESSIERVLLEQEALGKKFFISKKIQVLLQVTEFPYRRIDFEDTLKKDFAYYKGSWEIQNTDAGLDIVYRLDCERLFIVPNFIAKDALKKSAEELLADVRREILRRNEGGCCHEKESSE